MAHIQLLTPDVLAAREPKHQGGVGRRRSPERDALIATYTDLLAPLDVGYGGEVDLEEGEEKRIVRENLRHAADTLDLHLEFRPIKDRTRIHFRVISAEDFAARPRRGGGRPKKKAA